ncbi:hypothetical protein Tco_1104047 [Tanacetum coccineum]
MEPEDSLNMRDEHLSIISKKESDKVIKSSVEDLVPIPSESEDTFDNDGECDLPFCDDSFPLDVLGGISVTFSNPLFGSNDNFTSSDDESFPDEDDIESKESYVSNLDEHALLVTHLSELNEDECFDPGGDEIKACLTSDSIPPGMDGADFDLEGDILLLEKLPFEDRHYLSLTFVIKIFLPFLTYLVNSLLLLLSSRSEETIFDPGISAYSFYSLKPVAYESPMEICSSTFFVPNFTMISGLPGDVQRIENKAKRGGHRLTRPLAGGLAVVDRLNGGGQRWCATVDRCGDTWHSNDWVSGVKCQVRGLAANDWCRFRQYEVVALALTVNDCRLRFAIAFCLIEDPYCILPRGDSVETNGRILKTVCLRWVPTGKIFTSSTTKVDSEPPNGSKEDITNQCESEQALDVSVGTLLSTGTSFTSYKGYSEVLVAEKTDILENMALRNFDLMINIITFEHSSSSLGHQ